MEDKCCEKNHENHGKTSLDGVILSKVTVGLLIPLLMKDAIASILLWILKKFSVQPSWQNTSGRLLLWNKCCSVCNCCSLLVYYNWIKISAKSKSFLFKSLSLILLIINNYWQLVITAVFVWKEYVEDFTFKQLLLVRYAHVRYVKSLFTNILKQ